jgi:hypothetical protein
VVAAVAVWPGKPTPDDLLAARVANGYRPTPSLLRDGPTILGFAAKLGESVPWSDSPTCGIERCPIT